MHTQTTLFDHKPLTLESGATLNGVQVGYMTYGALNQDHSNAVLICHALTGDQYVSGTHPLTGKAGWWSRLVGPGKIIDTEKYFVICANVLGGCMGTTGPASVRRDTSQVWGLDFPVVTIGDMVEVQKALLDHMEIENLFAVIGGSMGGMQVLEWLTRYPEKLFSAICIASASRHTAQNIAFHEVGRQAIMADPRWQGGRYGQDDQPEKGLAVARMTAHVTYLSEAALTKKFGRQLQDRERPTFGFEADFQVESYLRHQGSSFVERFDANSYLYITRAMDYFDLSARHEGQLAEAFKKARHVRTTVVSFTSDWLYPTSESRMVVHALAGAGVPVSFTEIESNAGHDAFLLPVPAMDDLMTHVLDQSEAARGLKVSS